MSKDFRASQIETSKLIASGGIGETKLGLAIYSGSIASDRAGSVSDSAIFNNVGTDVFLFVSGARSNSDFNRSQVSLFGGDVVISGTLYAERQVIEVDGIVDGDMIVTGSLFVKPDSDSSAAVVFRKANGNDIFVVDSSKSLIQITGSIEQTGISKFSSGLSGSLTQLTDGSSYLIAGSNVTISSSSNGSITISSTDSQNVFNTISVSGQSNVVADSIADTLTFEGGNKITITTTPDEDKITFSSDLVTGTFHVPTPTTMVTTSSVSFSGEEGFNYSPASVGIDTHFFVSGTIGSKGTAVVGTSVFGGDVVISGSLHDGSGNIIYGSSSPSVFTNGLSGSLTQLTDGSSYLIAGSNITITSASNGAVTITSADTNSTYINGTGLNLATDAFPNTFSINDSIVATISGSTFTGVTKHNLGLSGSLTQLTDGTSYLIAGTNVTIVSSSNGAITIAATDTNSTYTNGTGLNLATDAFPNTFSINDSVVATISGSTFSGVTNHNAGLSGSLTRLTDGSPYLIAGANTTITSASNGAITIATTGGAANAFQTFAVAGQSNVVADSSTDTITFATGGGVNITTNALTDTITFSATSTTYDAGTGLILNEDNDFLIDNTIVATISGSTFSGATKHTAGLSGSLTQLTDGSSYLIAGSNVTITSASNGAVTISSAGGSSGNDVDWTDGGNKLVTTSSVSINSDNNYAESYGSDVFFFVSGSIDSIGQPIAGASIFGGDAFISGALGINTVKITSDGKIGIGTANPSYKLEVGGNAAFGEYLYHRGDTDTFIQFADDSIGITAGNEQLVTISQVDAGQDIVKIGDGGDVDFQVRTLNDDNTLYIEGSTDRIGVGTNSPASIVHIKESAPTLSIQRENNSNDSTIAFLGQAGATGAIMHLSSSNDLVFKTYDGSSTQEIMRLGGHQSSDVRQVILLSGSTMGAGAMQPKESTDINFFASGSMMSKGTSIRGTAVFGGDLVVSGAIYTGRLAAEDTPNNSYFDLTNTIEIRSGDQIEIRPTNNLDIVTQTGAMYFGDNIIDPKAADVNFFISGSIGGKGSSSKTIAAFGGDVYASGSAYFGSTSIFEGGIHEIYSGSSNPTGVFVHDCDNGHLFYHDSLSTNFTANFTNLNLNQSHATTLTLVLSQSATAYIPNAVQIGGAAQTIDWQGNSAPSGTSNGKDVVSFTIVNVAGSYIVLGQLVDFG